MFTNKHSRTEQPSHNRHEYIEPFEEADTDKDGTRAASTGKGFMAELDEWLDEAVFEPIERAIEDEDSKELHIAFTEAKQHIKRKVLASYHNGLKAKSALISNPKNHGQHPTRRRN